jgi:NADH-quinone oxidoreductase subunit E
MTDSQKLIHQYVSAEGLAEIDRWIAKYPPEEKRSAVMRALMVVQEAHGYLSESMMQAVADYLDMPPIAVYQVASFYTMYEKEPVGRHVVNVCTNISCKLRQSDKIVQALEEKMGISLGETTTDGRFTLRGVECLGACVNAPMMQIDKTYHEHLTPQQLDEILAQYK